MKNLKKPEYQTDQSGKLWEITGIWKIGMEEELSSEYGDGSPEVDYLLFKPDDLSDDEEIQVTHSYERVRTVTLTKKELLEVSVYDEDLEMNVDKEDGSFRDLVDEKLGNGDSYDFGDGKYTYRILKPL